MKIEGPYREMSDLEAEELKKMEKEIAAEGDKFSIQLPENIKIGGGVMLFGDAIKNGFEPEKIVFYSLATGILRYRSHNPDMWTKKNIYKYCDPKKSTVRLAVELPLKKYYPAIISSLSTKTTVEADEKRLREYQKQALINNINKFKQNIQEIKKSVENDEKFPFGCALDEALKQVYVTKLKELRTNLKLLLKTINDKLEATEKKE